MLLQRSFKLKKFVCVCACLCVRERGREMYVQYAHMYVGTHREDRGVCYSLPYLLEIGSSTEPGAGLAAIKLSSCSPPSFQAGVTGQCINVKLFTLVLEILTLVVILVHQTPSTMSHFPIQDFHSLTYRSCDINIILPQHFLAHQDP